MALLPSANLIREEITECADNKNPKVQSPTERPFRLRARNLVSLLIGLANEGVR